MNNALFSHRWWMYKEEDKTGALEYALLLNRLKAGDEGSEFRPEWRSLYGYASGRHILLYESHVPDGYIPPLGRFELIVGADETTIRPTWVTGSLNSAGTVSESTDAETGQKTYTVLIRNVAGISLPSTGGMGTGIYYLVGGLLVCCAASLLIKRKWGY